MTNQIFNIPTYNYEKRKAVSLEKKVIKAVALCIEGITTGITPTEYVYLQEYVSQLNADHTRKEILDLIAIGNLHENARKWVCSANFDDLHVCEVEQMEMLIII